MERVRKTFDIKIHRYDQLSENSKAIIDLLWPNGDYPKGSSLHKTAKSHKLDIDTYLLQRFNSDKPIHNIGRASRVLSKEEKQGLSDYWKGKKKSDEHSLRIKEAKQGDKNPMYAWERSELHRQRSSESILKAKAHLRETDEYKRRRLETDNNRVQRNIYEYTLWRKEVFQRDDYTCLKTRQKGGKLHAHHLWPFASNADLRFDVFNGVTLSAEAHRDFHNRYGTKNTTVDQFEEWLGRELPPNIREQVEIQAGWDMYEHMQGLSEYEDN